MTNKQIIIDGVDVSECINFRPDVDTAQVNYTNACSIGIWQRWYSNLEPSCVMSCSCKDNPNCYYKQLKRKEQECEKLKNWVKNMMFDTDRNDWFEHFAECFENWKKDLFKQLDQLKAENEELKKLLKVRIEDLCDSCGASSMKLMPCKVYEKTLTEIKEIANYSFNLSTSELMAKLEQILQKISECEVGNEN